MLVWMEMSRRSPRNWEQNEEDLKRNRRGGGTEEEEEEEVKVEEETCHVGQEKPPWTPFSQWPPFCLLVVVVKLEDAKAGHVSNDALIVESSQQLAFNTHKSMCMNILNKVHVTKPDAFSFTRFNLNVFKWRKAPLLFLRSVFNSPVQRFIAIEIILMKYIGLDYSKMIFFKRFLIVQISI